MDKLLMEITLEMMGFQFFDMSGNPCEFNLGNPLAAPTPREGKSLQTILAEAEKTAAKSVPKKREVDNSKKALQEHEGRAQMRAESVSKNPRKQHEGASLQPNVTAAVNAGSLSLRNETVLVNAAQKHKGRAQMSAEKPKKQPSKRVKLGTVEGKEKTRAVPYAKKLEPNSFGLTKVAMWQRSYKNASVDDKNLEIIQHAIEASILAKVSFLPPQSNLAVEQKQKKASAVPNAKMSVPQSSGLTLATHVQERFHQQASADLQTMQPSVLGKEATNPLAETGMANGIFMLPQIKPLEKKASAVPHSSGFIGAIHIQERFHQQYSFYEDVQRSMLGKEAPKTSAETGMAKGIFLPPPPNLAVEQKQKASAVPNAKMLVPQSSGPTKAPAATYVPERAYQNQYAARILNIKQSISLSAAIEKRQKDSEAFSAKALLEQQNRVLWLKQQKAKEQEPKDHEVSTLK